MEILNLSLPATNRFASNYLAQTPDILPFFHYRFNDAEEDKRRLDELKARTFPRMELAAYIEEFMKGFPASEAVFRSITKLKDPNSAVVIGGQQAGLLTGPLYSIHKVISIIKLAEQKEKELNIPVVPVFWIAGEDHDYQEVNHLFVQVAEKVDKWIYPEKILNKKMVSDIELNKEVCLSWVHKVLSNLGETEHTNTLLAFAEEQIRKSSTLVDFFANIVMELFKEYGLLIVDSGDSRFRELQKEFLKEQINNQNAITSLLLEEQQEIKKKGFPVAIEADERAANLFFYDTNRQERILLELDPDSDKFVGKSGTFSFSKDDLLNLASSTPAKLSNNVVTRPIMQEWLFPTIAFIAGPGEIAYWAELKLVFEHFQIKMPPIVPRLNITILDRSVETDLTDLNLQLPDVLSSGTASEKEKFLGEIQDKEIDEIFSGVKKALLDHYHLIETKTESLDRGLLPLVKKNENHLLRELAFMQKKLEDSARLKHEVILKKYDRVNLSLRPDGFPQERIWNIFNYFNLYGLGFIHDLLAPDYEFDGLHKVIKM